MPDSDVLIAGAGPTGLVLALWLTKLGVRVRLIDKAAGPGTSSRALAVQARTLELYRQLGLAEAVVQKGHKVPAINFWVKGERAVHLPFAKIGEGLTPFPFLHIFPQDEHERLLIERLAELGGAVERDTELVGFEEGGSLVRARLRLAGGREEMCEANYLAGCDGARSVVRDRLGTGFPGGTYRKLFYVADVEAGGPAIDGELHIDLDEADFLAVFPLAGPGRARLIGTVRDERADQAESLKFDDVSDRAIEHLKVRVDKVNWISTYHTHHRVTEHFRRGRVFLLGDAAHIHSPAGGQGMNTGIGDAINLAWKLRAVLQDAAPVSLLDSYEAERIGFARKLVATTDRVFTFATAEGPIADLLRVRVAPLLLPSVTAFEAPREFLFRTASQISLNYRDGPLSRGKAGAVQGGDRLPWVTIDGADNFAPLDAMAWQVHVYGQVAGEVSAWCSAHGIPLHLYGWRDEFAAAGLARDALYLVRPDGYVGLADPTGKCEALDRYWTGQGLRDGPLRD